jgi:hypothetical protein
MTQSWSRARFLPVGLVLMCSLGVAQSLASQQLAAVTSFALTPRILASYAGLLLWPWPLTARHTADQLLGGWAAIGAERFLYLPAVGFVLNDLSAVYLRVGREAEAWRLRGDVQRELGFFDRAARVRQGSL